MPGTQPPANLEAYAAVLFDLDGVLTPTADLHMKAWSALFTAYLAELPDAQPYTDDDYYTHLDGKKRDDGVSAVLASRGIELPFGSPDDDESAETVSGLGNRKNAEFTRILHRDGIAPYPGSKALVDDLRSHGVPVAVVSSSKNARWVLEAAGLLPYFSVIVDGVVATEEGLPGKPAPDLFLDGARKLGVTPASSVVFEDALVGVAAGHAGGFGLVVGVDRGAGQQALLDAGASVVVDDLAVFVRTGAGS
ncbi:haloacid dehalogenase [Subtercola boreus]|uniref:Beta-phosphoglucomutase n=1 Tax=Subtercola boreus TaxID=120213 RepID=A0A3E0WBX2_9MICO|nr:haloacid dehalogenase [Subtercola boreus]RFA21744.1 haloacid dehalogenase [Subtercola boreus]RFA27715.1 haloacid dehalogenase [Subtercola boreus]